MKWLLMIDGTIVMPCGLPLSLGGIASCLCAPEAELGQNFNSYQLAVVVEIQLDPRTFVFLNHIIKSNALRHYPGFRPMAGKRDICCMSIFSGYLYANFFL
jgi:hypothetical protein